MRDTRKHWHTFEPVIDKGEEIYHIAGADKLIFQRDGKLDAYTLMHYLYRFRFEEKLLEHFVETYSIKRGRALDAGCGTGRNAVVLSRYFEQVDAFDLSEKFISENKSRFSNIKNISFFGLDIKYIESLKEIYDFVLLGGLLMYLSDDESKALLDWTNRHLSVKGIAIVRDTLSKEKTKYAEHLKIYRSRKDFEELFSKKSFSLLKIANGSNRNIWVSIFSRLPKIAQELSFVSNFFTKAALLWVSRDVNRSLISPFKRHKHANQLFYAYKNFI